MASSAMRMCIIYCEDARMVCIVPSPGVIHVLATALSADPFHPVFVQKSTQTEHAKPESSAKQKTGQSG